MMNSNETAFIIFLSSSFCLLLSMLAASDTWIIKQWPVEYTTESITSKIFVHTKYGEFESDKKIDYDNWSRNLPGYIIQECTAFGDIKYSHFTTEPVVEK